MIQVRDIQEVLSLLEPDERVRIFIRHPESGIEVQSEAIPRSTRDEDDGILVLDFSE